MGFLPAGYSRYALPALPYYFRTIFNQSYITDGSRRPRAVAQFRIPNYELRSRFPVLPIFVIHLRDYILNRLNLLLPGGLRHHQNAHTTESSRKRAAQYFHFKKNFLPPQGGRKFWVSPEAKPGLKDLRFQIQPKSGTNAARVMDDKVAIDVDKAVTADARGKPTKEAGRPKPPPARRIANFCHPVAVMGVR